MCLLPFNYFVHTLITKSFLLSHKLFSNWLQAYASLKFIYTCFFKKTLIIITMTEIYHNLVSLNKHRCILCRSNIFVLSHKAMMKNFKMSGRFVSRLETFIWTLCLPVYWLFIRVSLIAIYFPKTLFLFPIWFSYIFLCEFKEMVGSRVSTK